MLTDPSPRVTDGRYFRSVLGNYPTGVAAITAVGRGGEPVGMIVGTFSSVSLDPPLVSFTPTKDSASFKALRESKSFCVNILGEQQEEICRALAVKGADDKFTSVRWRPADSGSPIIENSVAWIDCDFESITEAGDHYIVLGAVRDLAISKDSPDLPLLFFQGGYGRFSPHSRVMPAATDALEQIRFVDMARHHMESLAAELGMECSAVAPVENFLVRLASAGVPPTGGTPVRVGIRLPFEAPMGALLVAWADPATQDRWLDRGVPREDVKERTRHRDALERVRAKGWTITMVSEGFRSIDKRLENLAAEGPTRQPDPHLSQLASSLNGPAAYERDEILPSETYQVRNVSAPVFDSEGKVVLYLTLFGFPVSTRGDRVLDIVARLVETASRVSDTISWAGLRESVANAERRA